MSDKNKCCICNKWTPDPNTSKIININNKLKMIEEIIHPKKCEIIIPDFEWISINGVYYKILLHIKDPNK